MAHEEAKQQLLKVIDEEGLGPVVACDFIDTDNADFPVLVRLMLDQSSPAKVETLGRWMERIRVWDMTAGRYNARDKVVKLNIRGQAGTTAMVISVPFDERTETAAAALIDARIERIQPFELLDALTDLAH